MAFATVLKLLHVQARLLSKVRDTTPGRHIMVLAVRKVVDRGKNRDSTPDNHGPIEACRCRVRCGRKADHDQSKTEKEQSEAIHERTHHAHVPPWWRNRVGREAICQSTGDRDPVGAENGDGGERGDDVEGDDGAERNEGEERYDDEGDEDRVPRYVGCVGDLGYVNLCSCGSTGASLTRERMLLNGSPPSRAKVNICRDEAVVVVSWLKNSNRIIKVTMTTVMLSLLVALSNTCWYGCPDGEPRIDLRSGPRL